MSYQSVPRTNYQPPSLAPYMEPGEDASGFVKLEIETVDLTVGGLSGEISLSSRCSYLRRSKRIGLWSGR